MVVPTFLNAENLDLQKHYDEFSKYVLTPVNLMEVKHKFIVEKMAYIKNLNEHIKLKEVGKSVEGRSINMFSFGQGDTKILLWSQMHGDEPTASAGLLSVFYYFAQNFDQPIVQTIYKNVTIHAIVMLNPDGAERYQRRNVQGIDVNRDAQHLASPEGQTLKRVHDQILPDYGFNLHDMRGRETVGETGEILTKALMAPPYNKENEDSPTRAKAKKLAVIIKNALDYFIKGHVAKYKAGYMPRAFGDAFQNWGVSTVLIESGIANTSEPHHLTRLSFISLLAAFDAIANDYLDEINPEAYDQIPIEGTELFDLLIKNATIYNGKSQGSFKGDIGINISDAWKNNRTVLTGKIEDIGDLSITSGRTVISDDDIIVTPGFISVSDNPDDLELWEGITSLVDSDDIYAKQQYNVQNFDKIQLDNISAYTSKPAEQLNLADKGQVDIDKIADLLVFKSNQSDNILKADLLYVIKNGQIVYKKENE
jgi:hypothetical protein